MYLVALILLVVLCLGAMPSWPYSRSWGYYPAGGLGTLVVILLIVVLFRGTPLW